LKLGFSESLAGVTFLAFGNGAPDVLSALSASGGDADGIYLAIGALLGAGLFVVTVVGSVVILSAPKPIHVLPKVFLRDAGFYMLGPIILAISAIYGKLSLHFSITFLVVYAIFVIVVVISDKIDKKQLKKDEQSTLESMESDDNLDVTEKQLLLEEDMNEDASKDLSGEIPPQLNRSKSHDTEGSH
jgi:solute carrier family 24 (sodium/potassium/calcium exchanger), member 6